MLFNESFWLAFSIILFFVLVFKRLKGVLYKSLNAKIALIEEKLNLSASIRSEAEKVLTEHKELLKNAHAKAQELISATREEINFLKASNEEKIINLILAKKSSIIQKLRNDEDKLIHQLRVQIIKLAVTACADNFSKNNTLNKQNEALVFEALKKAKL